MVLVTSLLFLHLLSRASAGTARQTGGAPSKPSGRAASISTALFEDLERLSRIVDISYCVGNTGVHKPFDCLFRCVEFPELSLVSTWSTGVLLGDSCGYIAVDQRGSRLPVAGAKGPGDGDDVSSLGRGALIVPFRGTYSITNTIVDLSTVPQPYIPYPSADDGNDGPRHECVNCTVHTGFFLSWRSARRVVLPKLRALKAQHPSLPVHLVGHSLGGAVACLAALELRLLLGWDDVLVTTFGEPRAGN